MGKIIVPKHGNGPQNDGERKVLKYLSENLPLISNKIGKQDSDYIIIPNLEIPDSNNRFLEIDTIVISPHAIYVVEVKDWGPRIEGNDNEWYLNGTKERRNPHCNLNYKCRVLKSILTNHSADLRKIWLQGIVVIARDNVILDLDGSCLFTTFTLDESLIDYLQNPSKLTTPNEIKEKAIVEYQKEITEIIIGKGRSQKNEPLVIEGYQIEEQINIQESLIEYLARPIHGHKPGTLKRLRVFSVPVYVNEEERQILNQKILRDYEALESIGTHPNIVSLKGFIKTESGQIIEVLDWAEEGTLRSTISKGTLTLDQKFTIVKGIASGLKAAHEKRIIHRDLRPENILMSPTGPQLMNFDRAYMSDQNLKTVWNTVRDDSDRRYLPPELSLPKGEYDVFESSDLYSLGVIFYELLCNQIPFNGPEALVSGGGILPDNLLPSEKISGLPDWIDEIIKKLYTSEVDNRYGSAEEFLTDFYNKLSPSPNKTDASSPHPIEIPSEPNTDPNRTFDIGERIGDYRIVHHIKSGGFAQVYRATHVLHDKEYALKVNNQSVPLAALIDEFTILNQLSHPNIVKVYWSGQLPGGRYYIAMEYLKGEGLDAYAWGNKSLTFSQAVDVGKDVLKALRYMHEGEQKSGELKGKKLYHRDIKPNNIIWVTNRGFVLIDFNIAKEAEQSHTFAGTGRYIAPDLVQGIKIQWDDSGDTFALGVTLYEIICKQHPYPNQNPQINIKPIHPHQTIEGKELSNEFAEFLFKAVQPKAEIRFKTAKEMEDAINTISKGKLYQVPKIVSQTISFELNEEEKQLRNYNPFVKRLRRLFSQAKFSNAGTRGLDDVARKTYITTKLDEELLPAILNGEYKLIIITGNAGDGKTALIQQLEAKASNLELLPSKNGSRFTIKGITFQSNYDGSQDEGEIPNDLVLENFLKPFSGLREISNALEGRILAINEGRLIEFLCVEERKAKYGYLYDVIDNYFNQHGAITLPKQMMVINLNWRSIVACSEKSPSLIEKQLQAILKEELWKPCSLCENRDRCFIFYNVQSLNDKSAGLEIRNRLSYLFEAINLQRQLHITMRDLRSALSFIICRDYGCEDIPKLLTEMKPIDYLSLSYWNLTDNQSSDAGNGDRLINLLRQLDIGKVAHPSLDRDLYFLPFNQIQTLGMSTRDTDCMGQILTNLHQKNEELVPVDMDVEIRESAKHFHSLLIRKVYFEGRNNGVKNRLPYSNLTTFKEILSGNFMEQEKARKMLISAISLSEGCRNKDLVSKNICIAASQEQDPRWASFRLFPESDFEILVPELGSLGSFLEHNPDCFLLCHKIHQDISLEVNLELFELMTYVSKGFSPSLNDLHGRFIELIIFKNTLQHLPYRSVLLTEDHQKFYRIFATDENKLVLEKV